MGWSLGDISEKCDNCRTAYTELFQEKQKLKNLLKEAKEQICQDCVSEYGSCENITCKRVEKYIEATK